MMDKSMSLELKALAVFAVLMKLVLWFSVPLLTDEAYFISWGQNFDWGYYDHTPMIGWIVGLMKPVVNHYWWFRAFPFVSHLVIAYVLYRYCLEQGKDREKALLVALVFFLSLGSVLHFPVLNDTALFFFSALSSYFFLRYLSSWRTLDINLSLLLLGCAFLSKYLAVFLGLAYLATLLAFHRNKVLGFLLRTACIIAPFVAINLIWNYLNCWNNLMFNGLNRHSTGPDVSVVEYLVSLLVLLNPFVLFALFKLFKTKMVELDKRLLVLALIPLVLFLLLSFRQLIGVHWFLPFLPVVYLLLAYLPVNDLRFLARWSLVFSVSVVLVALIALLNIDVIMKHKDLDYSRYMYLLEPELVCDVFDQQVPSDLTLFTRGYSTSSVLGHICKRDMPAIFGTGMHGRQADKDFDLRAYDGQDMALYLDKAKYKSYIRYFESYEVKRFAAGKGEVRLFFGYGFNFELYRETTLQELKGLYYEIPSWLPKGQCYFYDWYFPTEDY